MSKLFYWGMINLHQKMAELFWEGLKISESTVNGSIGHQKHLFNFYLNVTLLQNILVIQQLWNIELSCQLVENYFPFPIVGQSCW